jgi:thiamine phosphate synthase YjbQ (UPF0047 family)
VHQSGRVNKPEMIPMEETSTATKKNTRFILIQVQIETTILISLNCRVGACHHTAEKLTLSVFSQSAMSLEALSMIEEYDQIVHQERVRRRHAVTRIGNVARHLYATLNNLQHNISVSSVTFERIMEILDSGKYLINLRKHNAFFIPSHGHYSGGERATITTAYGPLSFVLGGNFRRSPDGNVVFDWTATFSGENGYEESDHSDDDGYF